MPASKYILSINADGYETAVRGTPMYPCGAYEYRILPNEAYEVPLHWHEELEVIFVLTGVMRLRINETSYTMHGNEGVFINANALHEITLDSDEGCVFVSLVFFSSLLSGAVESVYEQRYIRPLTGSALPAVLLRDDGAWQHQASQCILEAHEANVSEAYGYELVVREKLSRMLYLIVTQKQAELSKGEENTDIPRIRSMLLYLRAHYTEPITLRQVAAAAHIGERECLRCFQRTLGQPPMQALLKHRLSVAARLLADTDTPVTEISSRAGFDSASYFSKMFKRAMHCTPSEYRKSRRR